jgi:hypothetical protein
MTTVVEQAVTRAVRGADGRSWLRWGTAVFAGFETVHIVGGTLGNDWEGWRTFFENFAFIVVTGLVLVGSTYGLLVRWGLQPSPRGRNRAALAGLAAGVLSIASYPLFFTWAPLLIAPAALLLGRAGLARAKEGQGGSRFAAAGVLAGLATLVFAAFLLTYAVLHDGNYPWIFGG